MNVNTIILHNFENTSEWEQQKCPPVGHFAVEDSDWWPTGGHIAVNVYVITAIILKSNYWDVQRTLGKLHVI